MRLIEGAIMPEDEPLENNELREEIRDLKEQLRAARNETAIAKRESGRALSALRKQLNPLYQALQMVYGELDTLVDEEVSSPTTTNARTSAVWEQWKNKLDKGCSKAIDALLIHGEMTRRQLAIATGYSPQNVSNIVSKLNGASLITKNGDQIALRKL